MCVTDTKLLLKVKDPTDDALEYKWVHLCYVDTEIYEKFTRILGSEEQLNRILSFWCKEDFDIELDMATTEDLNILKESIKEYYRTKYPEIYRYSKTDRQGWTRIWVTNKMRKVVEGIGKESK